MPKSCRPEHLWCRRECAVVTMCVSQCCTILSACFLILHFFSSFSFFLFCLVSLCGIRGWLFIHGLVTCAGKPYVVVALFHFALLYIFDGILLKKTNCGMTERKVRFEFRFFFFSGILLLVQQCTSQPALKDPYNAAALDMHMLAPNFVIFLECLVHHKRCLGICITPRFLVYLFYVD